MIASEYQPRATPGRLFLRLLVGAESLASERIAASLQLIDEIRPRDAAITPSHSSTLRQVCIGALASAPGWVGAGLGRARPLAGRAGRLLHGLRGWSHVPGTRSVIRRYRAVRTGVATRVGQWAAIGREEEREGKLLAETAVAATVAATLASLADSPDLRRLIEEQTESLAHAAVDEVRDGAARADRITEAIVRRLVHRPVRGPEEDPDR